MSHVGLADYYEPPDPAPTPPTLEERLDALREDLYEYSRKAHAERWRGPVSDRLALFVDDEYVRQLLRNVARAARAQDAAVAAAAEGEREARP